MDITIDQLVKLLVSVLCGGIIGWERYKNHKAAGFRTMILVCLGSTLIMMLSQDYLSGDMLRIVAGIVTGIGFLGAGAIFATKGNIHGITTAASIWVVAAIGMTVGVGAYLLSIIVTILTFVILELGFIEKRFKN